MTIDESLRERLKSEKLAREQKRSGQDRGGGSGGGEPPDQSDLDRRVAALERSLVAIDRTLAVMSEQLKHLASKDDVRAVQVELATRFGKLDADVAAIGAKLDTKASSADLAILAGKLDGKADATDLAELKGRVARIPTVPVLTSILVFVSFLFAAVTWVLRHLPPAWSSALQ